MFGRIKADNFFNTTIASIINDSDVVGTFDVASKTVNWYTLEDGDYMFRMAVWLNNQAEAEIFRVTNVTWTTLTYDKRVSPQWLFEHTVWQLCVMTVASDFVNWLSLNTSDFGYCETVPWTGNELKVKVYGWRVYKDSAVDVVIADTTLTIDAEETNYIYFDDALDAFGFTSTEPASYFVIAKVVTDITTITSLEDYRANIVSAGWGGWGWGWHVIKLTDQAGVSSTLTQRDTMRFKKLKVTDDWTNLETVVEAKRLATPDIIPTWTVEYIEAWEQMIVYGGLTVDGTLDNEGTLVVL